MAFCYKCGQKLPEGANFCISCGAPVITPDGAQERARAETGPTGYTVPQKTADKRQAIGLLVFLAAVLISVIVMLATHSGAGTRTAETAQTPEPAHAMEPTPGPEPTPEPAPTLDTTEGAVRTLMANYRDILDAVLATVDANPAAEWARQLNCGNLYDYDGDGYPELLALYSPDGTRLHALTARGLDSGEPYCAEQYMGDLVGGAKGEIYFGVLANVPMLHLIYINYDGDVRVGRDTILGFTDDGLEPMYNLTWEEMIDGSEGRYLVGGTEDKAVFDMLMQSRAGCECVFPAEEPYPLEQLRDEAASSS